MATTEPLLTKIKIKNGKPVELAGELVLERLPVVFGNDWDLYRSWRGLLASKIGVDPCDIVVTGSAASGFSLNPAKKLSAFHIDSDIDLAIVSPLYFDQAWRTLRETKSSQVQAVDWDYVLDHKKFYIFEGCIALDRILHLMPFAATWKSALAMMQNAKPTLDRDIKARLYRDNDSIRLYQRFGLEKIQAALIKGEL